VHPYRARTSPVSGTSWPHTARLDGAAREPATPMPAGAGRRRARLFVDGSTWGWGRASPRAAPSRTHAVGGSPALDDRDRGPGGGPGGVGPGAGGLPSAADLHGHRPVGRPGGLQAQLRRPRSGQHRRGDGSRAVPVRL
jgi:hypothetical protein